MCIVECVHYVCQLLLHCHITIINATPKQAAKLKAKQVTTPSSTSAVGTSGSGTFTLNQQQSSSISGSPVKGKEWRQSLSPQLSNIHPTSVTRQEVRTTAVHQKEPKSKTQSSHNPGISMIVMS